MSHHRFAAPLLAILLGSTCHAGGASAAASASPGRIPNVVHLWLDGEDDARLVVRVGDMLVMRHLRSRGRPVRMFVDVPEGREAWVEFEPSTSGFPEHDLSGNAVDVETVSVHLRDPSDLSSGIVRHAGKGTPPDHPLEEVR